MVNPRYKESFCISVIIFSTLLSLPHSSFFSDSFSSPPLPLPLLSLFTLRAIFYYVLLLVAIIMRNTIANAHYYCLAAIPLYFLLMLTDRGRDVFTTLSHPPINSNYIKITSWFIVRKTLLQDIEDALRTVFVNYKIVITKLSPTEFNVYFNDSGFYTHIIVKVYSTSSTMWVRNYIITYLSMEGCHTSKYFHSLHQVIGQKYTVMSKKMVMISDPSEEIQVSNPMLEQSLKFVYHHSDNENYAIGLRLLINVLEETQQPTGTPSLLFLRFDLVSKLEDILFNEDEKPIQDDIRLMAITALRLIFVKNLCEPDVSKYKTLTSTLDDANNPLKDCSYYHGTISRSDAKRVISKSHLWQTYLVFTDKQNHEMYLMIFNYNSIFQTFKIGYDSKLFILKNRKYKTMDDLIYDQDLFCQPIQRDNKNVLIAIEALAIMKL